MAYAGRMPAIHFTALAAGSRGRAPLNLFSPSAFNWL